MLQFSLVHSFYYDSLSTGSVVLFGFPFNCESLEFQHTQPRHFLIVKWDQFEKLIFPKSYIIVCIEFEIIYQWTLEIMHISFRDSSVQVHRVKKKKSEEQDVFPVAVAAYTVEKIQILYYIHTEQRISSLASTPTNHSSDNGVK